MNVPSRKDILTGNRKKATPLTSGIQYWGVRGLVRLIALAKFITVGQEISPKTPNIAYPVSLCPILERHKQTTIDNEI
jgi:hypothetical protein